MFENDGCREEDLVGNTAGTPHFMSPEMVQKGNFMPKNMIYGQLNNTVHDVCWAPPFRAKSRQLYLIKLKKVRLIIIIKFLMKMQI